MVNQGCDHLLGEEMNGLLGSTQCHSPVATSQYQTLFFFHCPEAKEKNRSVCCCCCPCFFVGFRCPDLVLKSQLEVGQLRFFEQLIKFTLSITYLAGLSYCRPLCSSPNCPGASSQTSRDSPYAQSPRTYSNEPVYRDLN